MKNNHLALKALVIALSLGLQACGGGSTTILTDENDNQNGQNPDGQNPDGQNPGGNPDGNSADVPAILQADSADELIRSSLLSHYTKNSAELGGGRGAVANFGAPDVLATESTAADSSDDSGVNQSRFSDTNVQEEGVDEADRVKIDGNVLFALEDASNEYFGRPIALTVADEPLTYRPQTDVISAYRLDGDNSELLSRFSVDALRGRSVTGMYLHKNGANRDLVLVAGEEFAVFDSWRSSYYYDWSRGTTKVALVNASDTGNMSNGRSIEIDGHLVSSRKIDNRLILVTRYSPFIDGMVPYVNNESDAETNRNVIANADTADFLPQLTVSDGGNVTTRPAINDNLCYSTKKESDLSTSRLPVTPSPTIISIVTVNLDNLDSDVQNACFVGDSETLYVSRQAAYLATTEYQYNVPGVIFTDSAEESIASDSFVSYYPPEITTQIHKFSFGSSGKPVFKGSGSVKGHLGWNQNRKPYRMSEKDNMLRVVTFDESRASSPVTLNILQEANGKLGTLSTLPNESRPNAIGKPGESLYASRFIGDKAYLVTFRVTDPLYVLDVSNPRDPYIAGELEIPGYSDYLHPVNDSLLIGLGKDAIADNGTGWGDGRGAWYQGVKLALYDVADPSNPFVADERIIGKRGTESPALYQQLAFSYLSGDSNSNPKFAFPVSINNGGTFDSGPWAWANWTSNAVYTMEVDENSRSFVDRQNWTFERADGTGNSYSPVGLENDRAVIGSDGGLYVLHNGSLHYGQWDTSAPTASTGD